MRHFFVVEQGTLHSTCKAAHPSPYLSVRLCACHVSSNINGVLRNFNYTVYALSFRHSTNVNGPLERDAEDLKATFIYLGFVGVAIEHVLSFG